MTLFSIRNHLQSGYMFLVQNKRIYLDHASATPIDARVYNDMKPYLEEKFHNPSALYTEAVETRAVIEAARHTVADLLRARPQEIVFVDGATEGNNMAILGTVRAWQKQHHGEVPHVITTSIEHASVYEVCRHLENEGVQVTYLNVDTDGQIHLQELKQSITPNTVIISIGYVNGEIGTIQDIRGVMKAVRHYRKHNTSSYPYVHTDAVQAVNYVEEIGVPQLGVDLMVINAAKIYGPKKIATLYVKTGVAIEPILYGGNQERTLRSGTEHVAGIVGMARSLSLARKHQPSESLRLTSIKNYFVSKLQDNFPDIVINASDGESIPNIVNVTFPHISHEEIVIRLDAQGIMCSVKSACKAGEDGDSHVIQAITNGADRPTGSIRFSMGRTTTKRDIDRTFRALHTIVHSMNDTYTKYYQS